MVDSCDNFVKTGFSFLDETTGGLRNGSLIMLVGAPGHGKTSLALNIVSNIVHRGGNVGMFSLECPDFYIYKRLGILGTGITAEMQQFLLIDTPNIKLSDMAVAAECMKAKGAEAILIDFPQGIQNTYDDYMEDFLHKSKTIKDLARHLSIPIVVFTNGMRQRRRIIDDKYSLIGPPYLEQSLYNKKEIIEVPDAIWLLHRHSTCEYFIDIRYRDKKPEYDAELIIAKGYDANVVDIPLKYDAEHPSFKDAGNFYVPYTDEEARRIYKILGDFKHLA